VVLFKGKPPAKPVDKVESYDIVTEKHKNMDRIKNEGLQLYLQQEVLHEQSTMTPGDH